MADYLSIVIGTYSQKPQKLLETIESILVQKIFSIKIFVVDDNYLAGFSNEIAMAIKNLNDERIVYINNGTNIGVPHVFRKWFSLVSSQYFMFYCEGDILIEGSLNKLLKLLDGNPELFCAHGREFDETGSLTNSLFPVSGIYSTQPYVDSKFGKGSFGWSNASAVYRTEIVKWHDLVVVNNWYWDYQYQLKLLILSDKIGYIDEPIAKRDGDGKDYFDELEKNYFKINTERIVLAYHFLLENELYMLMKNFNVSSYKLSIAKRLLISCFRENDKQKRQLALRIFIIIYFNNVLFYLVDVPFRLLKIVKNSYYAIN